MENGSEEIEVPLPENFARVLPTISGILRIKNFGVKGLSSYAFFHNHLACDRGSTSCGPASSPRLRQKCMACT